MVLLEKTISPDLEIGFRVSDVSLNSSKTVHAHSFLLRDQTFIALKCCSTSESFGNKWISNECRANSAFHRHQPSSTVHMHEDISQM